MRFSSFIYLVGQGLHSMKANRLMTFASMGVLTVCMILVGTAFLFGVNIDAVVQYMGSQNESYVSVSDDATEEQINALGDQIGAVNGVSSVVFISREEALQQYDTIALLLHRPLRRPGGGQPPAADVSASRSTTWPRCSALSTRSAPSNSSTALTPPSTTANTFLSLQRIVNYICIGLVGVLALVSIVVISNTIRITVFARRKEIAIMKLVGATNGFIRFPFFVEGTTSGLLAAAHLLRHRLRGVLCAVPLVS